MNSTANGDASAKGLGKKILKVAVTFGITVTTFFVLSLLWIFYKLPSPSELKSTFFREVQMAESSTADPESDIAIPAPTDEPAQVGEALSPPQKPKKSEAELQDMNLMLEEFSDQSDGISKACSALEKGSPSIFSQPNAAKNFDQALVKSIESGVRDPGIEAVLPSVRYLFSFSSMKDLIATVQAAEGGEDFAQKAEFYSKVYTAYQELKANQANLENIFDRSYLLYMMMKVAEKNPLAMQSSEALAYCREIEGALNQGLSYDAQVEAQEFLKFLENANVKPEEIGFDPNQKTQLSLEYSDRGIQVKNTWLDEAFEFSSAKTQQTK